jgi:thiol-disulfide isomerase/thioredoxin
MGTLMAVLMAWGAGGGGDTVLLAFQTETCPPCRQMAPVLEQLITLGHPIRKIDLAREPAVAKRYRVDRVPCYVMLVDGREVDRVVGAVPPERIARLLALAAPQPGLQTAPVPWVSTPAASASPAGAKAIPAVRSAAPFSASAPTGLAANGNAPPATSSSEEIGLAPLVRGSGDGSPLPAGVSAAGRLALAADPSPLLLAATVRLRIEDATGRSRGTGTVIDARRDHALVLTCGHLFRDSQGKGKIEVDLFGSTRVETLIGKLIHYDLDADLALIEIPVSGPIQVARVAPADYVVSKGAKAFNVGCNNGENPTVRQTHITAIDKFVGHSNIEASGVPLQGRSGGGLFAAEGFLIGVCNAAVPTDNEGMYAGLKTIHALLAQQKLGFVCPSGSEKKPAALELVRDLPKMPAKMPPPADLLPTTGSRDTVPASPAASLDRPDASANGRRNSNAAGPGPTSVRSAGEHPPLSDDERASLDMIARRKADGDEVICIIRSREKPAAQSEILVIDNASPAFVDAISGAGARRNAVGPLEKPATLATTPAVGGNRRSDPNVQPPSTADDRDWRPRWLQPGYQGQ